MIRKGLRSAAGLKPLVLIAGGGVAALETLLALRDLIGDRIALEMVAPGRDLPYAPLAVGEPFGLGEARRYDLGAICSDQDARLTQGVVESVEPVHHRVWTGDGKRHSYDALVVAVGATPAPWLHEAVTIFGPGYTGRFSAVLADLERRRSGQLTFVVPPGGAWPLPVYELALMTARWASERGLEGLQLRLITHEERPLGLFGAAAADAVERLLDAAHVALETSCAVVSTEADGVHVAPRRDVQLTPESVVTLPALSGPSIPGLQADGQGFIQVDAHGLVAGEDDVYAAGDATTVPLKQGGIAAQQADAVAEAIAARAGAPLTPMPFRPVLRGMLLTGAAPRYLRAEVAGGRGEDWEVSEHALWWPPTKIAGRYLSPYLAAHQEAFDTRVEQAGALPVEVELEQHPSTGVRRRVIISPDSTEGPVVLPVDAPEREADDRNRP